MSGRGAGGAAALLIGALALAAPPARADAAAAFGALVLERCLPAMVLGAPLDVAGLRRLPEAEKARVLSADAPGPLYASPEPEVLLHALAPDACGVLASGADTGPLDAFVRFWFDGAEDPFERTLREEDGDRLQERYVLAHAGVRVTALYSRAAGRGVALMTIHREPL